jgi:hypothetical protein
LTGHDPAVLGEARPGSVLEIGGLEARHEVGRDAVAVDIRIDTVEPRRIEPDDLRLPLGCQRVVPFLGIGRR